MNFKIINRFTELDSDGVLYIALEASRELAPMARAQLIIDGAVLDYPKEITDELHDLANNLMDIDQLCYKALNEIRQKNASILAGNNLANFVLHQIESRSLLSRLPVLDSLGELGLDLPSDLLSNLVNETQAFEERVDCLLANLRGRTFRISNREAYIRMKAADANAAPTGSPLSSEA
jgi:uncharacterized protein Yka (UPF0111/DUF47 family)